MGILAGTGWQQDRRMIVRYGRKPLDGGLENPGSSGRGFCGPLPWHITFWALQPPGGLLRLPGPWAQPLLEFSSGVPQLSLMGKQGEASFYIMEHFYQNKRSWKKVNTIEAQAEMEKTVPFMAKAMKSPLRNMMAGRALSSCQDSSQPSLCCWPSALAL